MANGSRFEPLARAVLRTQSDERLVRLVREGREAAFEEIVRRYRQPLVAFAAAYAPSEPEDVVQESLARSWESLRQSTGEMKLKPWLYTIVRNRALNARRDQRRHEPLDDRIDGVRQPAEIALTNEELERTVAAVRALPAEQREALVRSALEGHTHDQIAAAIGSTPGAVRQSIYRARLAVRHGVGAVIPLPLVAALVDLGAGGATAAGGAAAAGTGAAAGGAAGGSLAAKAAIVAVVGTIAAGSGVAIDNATRDSRDGPRVESAQAAPPPEASSNASRSARTATGDEPAGASGTGAGSLPAGGDGRGSQGAGGGDGGDGSGSHSGSPGASGEESGSDGGSAASDDDREEEHADGGDADGSSGPGSDDSGSDDAQPDDDSSGSGSGGHSGPGSSDEIDPVHPDGDSSGPGPLGLDEVESPDLDGLTEPEEADDSSSSGPGGGDGALAN